MPKETIRSAFTDRDGGYVTTVGWHPDQDVQVGVESGDGRSFAWLFFGNDVGSLGVEIRRMAAAIPTAGTGTSNETGDEALGRAVLNHFDTLGCDPSGGYSSVWAYLDRSMCNRLIQVLRRARDSAFGRDE